MQENKFSNWRFVHSLQSEMAQLSNCFLEDFFFLCNEVNEPHDVHYYQCVIVFVVVLKVLIYIMLC